MLEQINSPEDVKKLTLKQKQELANEIRNLGFNVEIEMNNRKLKKSIDYANKEKIPYVIVLGEDEVNRKSFNIKNMFSGEQKEIAFDDLTIINEIK